MLGYPAKVFLRFVETRAGSTGLDEVKRRAGIPADRNYRMNEVYADDELPRVVAAAAAVLELDPGAILELWCDAFFADTVQRWPVWYGTCTSAREFLERQPEIHNTFALGLRDPAERKKVSEKFRLDKLKDETVIHYRSPNRLCRVYVRLAGKVVDHYQDRAAIEERRCLHRGDSECRIHVLWR